MPTVISHSNDSSFASILLLVIMTRMTMKSIAAFHSGLSIRVDGSKTIVELGGSYDVFPSRPYYYYYYYYYYHGRRNERLLSTERR